MVLPDNFLLMKKLITELDVIKIFKNGIRAIPLDGNEILTPSAKDKINELGMKTVEKLPASIIDVEENLLSPQTNSNKVAIGSDHTGFKLKNLVAKILVDKRFEVIDAGTFDEKSCDYPDYALAVATKVKEGTAAWGIIIDATGNPSAITANKVYGIRAANCYNEFSARSAREHNNANILTLGAKALGEETVKSIIEAWLNSKFEGGRHQKRLDKISAIERRNLK